MLNSRQIGFQRAREIRDSVDQFGALVIEQLYAMHFKGLASGIDKARERMWSITKKSNYISKEKLDTSGRLFYYPTGKRPQHNRATLDITRNWGLLYLITLGKENFTR